jgi:hypothetical protein
MAVMTGVRRDEFRGRDDASSPARRSPRRSDRQRIDGLFDVHLVVAPDGGLAAPDRPGTSLTAAELVEEVRRTGGQDQDVRIVAPAGEQNLATLSALARLLDRDVLVSPPGAELQEVPAGAYPAASATAGGDEIVAVDLATGCPLDWWTIPPSGQIGAVPGWFDLAGGLVLPRTGPVVLPLPGGGLMFATREDFVARRTAAAALRPGHPGLVTVAVGVRSGQFVVGDYGGRSVQFGGAGLAAALASLPLYGADLRLWLRWPESAPERHRLGRGLTELAEVTGAMVWAPDEQSRVELRGGCRDLCAVGADGEPTGWRPYGPAGEAHFESDVDGRLVPLGGVVVRGYPPVALVSVQPGREEQLAVRYTRLRPRTDVYYADLAVLADGRLALRYRDGSLLAAGGRQLGQLLRAAGWRGGPIALLSPISPERAAGARQHSAELAEELGSPITFVDVPASTPLPGPASVPPPVRVRVRVPVPVPDAGPSARPDLAGPGSLRGPAELRIYSRLAVGRVLASLDPDSSESAGRHTALSRAVAEHATGRRLLAEARQPAERNRLIAELNQTAERIERLAGLGATPPDEAEPAGPPDEAEPAGPADRWPVGPDQVVPDQVAPELVAPADGGLGEGVQGDDFPDDGGPDDGWDNPFDGPGRGSWSDPDLVSRFIDGPRLAPAGRSAPPHLIGWLPPSPQTNSEEFDVYVECAVEPADALTNGVPSAHLFLLGYLDRQRLTARTSAGHLLQVRVQPEGAVDVGASEAAVPRILTDALSYNDVYLLPAAWLSRCHVVATLAVTPGGDPAVPDRSPEEHPVLLRCLDAGHGVPGLPVESVRWPHGSIRSTATRFALVPEKPLPEKLLHEKPLPEKPVRPEPADGPTAWLPLLQQRPQPSPGHRLLELRIVRGTAIDVAATAGDLAPLASVRSQAAQLVSAGVRVVLPVPSFARASVQREYRYDARGWQRARTASGVQLDAWMARREARD